MEAIQSVEVCSNDDISKTNVCRKVPIPNESACGDELVYWCLHVFTTSSVVKPWLEYEGDAYISTDI